MVLQDLLHGRPMHLPTTRGYFEYKYTQKGFRKHGRIKVNAQGEAVFFGGEWSDWEPCEPCSTYYCSLEERLGYTCTQQELDGYVPPLRTGSPPCDAHGG